MAEIFKNNPIVYWGFTGSNTQVKYYPPTLLDVDFGHLAFYFGSNITPRFVSEPSYDSCLGPPVLFIDSSLYSFNQLFDPISSSKWFWDFDDGTTSGERNPPAHQFQKPGIYNIRFTVTNQLGCALDTFIKKKTIGSKPVINFSVAAACTQSPVAFADSTRVNFGEPYEWNWEF